MELKRILARDSRAASEEAMEKYGRDVLIISSNRVNGQTELIVAIDVQAQTAASSVHTEAPKAPQPMANDVPGSDVDEDNPFEALLFAQHSRTQALEPLGATSDTLKPSAPVSPPAPAPEHQLATQYDHMRGSEIVALLKEELSAIRQEIRLHQQLGLAQLDALAPSLQPLMDELVERGLPPGLREHMTQAWKSLDDPIEALANLETELTRILPPAESPIALTGIHALVGPSGSGKSLACAKLAIAASDAFGPEQVAWISFADHRAGAWSQTQMLATPSGVATFRAGNAEGLKLLLQELAHMKLVLIDSAGVHFEQQLQAIREIEPEAALHMVLPMDATLTSIKRALRQHQDLSSVILSKMDESYSPWAMIQGLSQRQPRVAWINDSERLHTPMQTYAPQTLAEKALNTLGQLDEDDQDEHAAKALRLNDMHEVPDLTATLEPFQDDEEVEAAPPMATSPTPAHITEQYGIPQFGRIHLAG